MKLEQKQVDWEEEKSCWENSKLVNLMERKKGEKEGLAEEKELQEQLTRLGGK